MLLLRVLPGSGMETAAGSHSQDATLVPAAVLVCSAARPPCQGKACLQPLQLQKGAERLGTAASADGRKAWGTRMVLARSPCCQADAAECSTWRRCMASLKSVVCSSVQIAADRPSCQAPRVLQRQLEARRQSCGMTCVRIQPTARMSNIDVQRTTKTRVVRLT